MPTRLIREGILTSDAVNALSFEAEVFYRRVLNVVDDFGRFHADVRLLRCACYPLALDRVSEDDIAKWLMECVGQGLIDSYKVNSKPYLEVQRFGQQVRAKSSKFPANDYQEQGKCAADAKQTHSTCAADEVRLRTKTKAQTDANAQAQSQADAQPTFGGKAAAGQDCDAGKDSVVATYVGGQLTGRSLKPEDAALARADADAESQAKCWLTANQSDRIRLSRPNAKNLAKVIGQIGRDKAIELVRECERDHPDDPIAAAVMRMWAKAKESANPSSNQQSYESRRNSVSKPLYLNPTVD